MSGPDPAVEGSGAGRPADASPAMGLAARVAGAFNWKSFAVAVFGLAIWVAWLNADGIVDWWASDESMQGRIAISVGPPTVHTRERLLNDRFEQVAWLATELERTIPVKTGEAAADVPPGRKPDADKPVAKERSQGVSFSTRSDIRMRYGWDDPRQAFEVMNGYRDVLRAERARAMLDDRHDMDNNTLDLFSFDTTMMPRGDARGFGAVEVLITRNPADLLDGVPGRPEALARLENQRNADLFDTYVGWLEKIRELEQSNLDTLTQTLDELDMFSTNDQALLPVRSDYETTLRVAACGELLRVQGIPQNPEARRGACRAMATGSTPRDLRAEAAPEAQAAGEFRDAAAQAMREIDRLRVAALEKLAQGRSQAFLATVSSTVQIEWRRAARGLLAARQAQDWNDPVLTQRLRMVAYTGTGLVRTADEIVVECAGRSVDRLSAEAGAISPWLVEAVDASATGNVPVNPTFRCTGIVNNLSWRVLYGLISRLVGVPGDIAGIAPSALDPAGYPVGAASPEWSIAVAPGVELREKDVVAVPTSCLAAMLIEESAVRPTAEQPRNHGASLTEFFRIRVDRLSGGCAVTVQPLILSLRSPLRKSGDVDVLHRLDLLLEGPGYGDGPNGPATQAYGYSLSPRLRQRVEISASQNNAAGAESDAGSAGFSRARGLDYRGVEPEVLGFTRQGQSDAALRGARFGWLISPRPSQDFNVIVPMEQAQLGAVVSIPSWWRSALMQVCARFVPARAIASVMTDAFWNHREQCRVSLLRLPGSSADISRRLGMDVLTTPYMQNWKRPPVLYAGLTGEPSHLLITGERLWRNTVVTLGGQKADQIEVLPDMVGISATFRCIRMPTTGSQADATQEDGSPGNQGEAASVPVAGQAVASKPTDAKPGDANQTAGAAAVSDRRQPDTPYSVPVIVWTSEGHTRPQYVTVIVRTGSSAKPCPAPSDIPVGPPPQLQKRAGDAADGR